MAKSRDVRTREEKKKKKAKKPPAPPQTAAPFVLKRPAGPGTGSPPV